MSFIGSALGVTNGYQAQNGASAGYSTQLQNTENNNLIATYGNQGTLAQQLNAQANGQGPNLAQAQLQQATDQNNQKAAGAAASQRGMNPAIAQRIVAQNAAATNQAAAGQSATLRAQQQLNAEGAEGNVYGQQGQEMVSGLNTLAAAQTAANTTNAQTASSNQGLFGSIFAHGGEVKALPKHLQLMTVSNGEKIHPVHLAQGGLLGSNFSGSLMGLIKGLWSSGVSATPATTPASTQANISSQNAQMGAGPSQVDANGNLTSAGTQSQISQQNADMMSGPSTMDSTGMTEAPGVEDTTEMAGGAADAGATDAAATEAGAAAGAEEGDSLLELAAAHGAKVPSNHDRKVPAMISPGERFIPPHLVEAVRKGRIPASKAAPKVPGKPKVAGDSEQNDIVPARLSPGGVVIPRSKADNDADAREFLQALQAEKAKKGAPTGYTRVLTAKRRSA
jgi:hypothetical protein